MFFGKVERVACTIRNILTSSFFFIKVELNRTNDVVLTIRLLHIEILIFWALWLRSTSFYINVEIKSDRAFWLLNAFFVGNRIVVA